MICVFFRLALLLSFFISSTALALSLQVSGEENHRPSSVDTLEAHIGKGYQLVQDNRFQEAAKEFQAALSLNPSLVRVRYQLGVCYFAMQQWQEARQEFERLLREAAGDPSVIYHLGRLDLTEEKLDSAITRLKSVASNPPFEDTPYYLGSAYLKKGNLEAAEKWLKKAAELMPRDFRVADHLARVHVKAGRRVEAEKQFALAASLREHYNEASHQGIDCAHAITTQSFEEARAVCQKLFDPGDPDKLVTLGMIYGQYGHHAEALEPFERAARLDPESFEIQHNLGLSYFRLQRYADARGPLEKAVAIRPDYFGSNALLGATLYALKDDEAAYRVLEHAYLLNPQDADTSGLLFKVAIVLAQKRYVKKQYAGCLGYLQAAARLRPDDPEVHQRMAEVYDLLGQRDRAEREKREAERLRRSYLEGYPKVLSA